MTRRLPDRVCIVTGAASGIGRAIARRFAAEGAQVVILDPRSEPIEGGESTVDLITETGGQAERLDVDVSDWDALDAAVSETVERFGALHVMVNNAAIYTGSNLRDYQPRLGPGHGGQSAGCVQRRPDPVSLLVRKFDPLCLRNRAGLVIADTAAGVHCHSTVVARQPSRRDPRNPQYAAVGGFGQGNLICTKAVATCSNTGLGVHKRGYHT